MEPAAEPQLTSCVKEEIKVQSSGQFWSPTFGKNQAFYSPPRTNNKRPKYESAVEQQEQPAVPFLAQLNMADTYTAFPTMTTPCIKGETEEVKKDDLIIAPQIEDPNETSIKEEVVEIKEEPVSGLPDQKSEEKNCDIADLITQFINEGEVCMLNGTFSTTPLRQYLTEDESSLALDLESPKRSKKKTPIRRSLNEEMK